MDYKVTSSGSWAYALVLPSNDTTANMRFQRLAPPGKHPFAGLKSPTVEVQAQARQLKSWKMHPQHPKSPGPVPASPVCGSEAAGDCGPVETVSLVPFGSTRLRIAMFPSTPSAARLKADDNTDGVEALPLSKRRQLAIDPSFEVRGLQIGPYNVTKEPASPLITPSEPWEATLGYTSVVYAAEQNPPKFIAYWGGAMCCSKPGAECCNGSSTAMAQAECAAKMIMCRSTPPPPPPPIEQVAGYVALPDYIGSSDIGGASCASGHDCIKDAGAVCSSMRNCSGFGVYKGTMYQLYNNNATRHAYPLGKGWNSWRKDGSTAPPKRQCCQPCETCPTTPKTPPPPTGPGSDWPVDATLVAESLDGVTFTRPKLDQVRYGGMAATNVVQMNESYGLDARPYGEIPIADGNRNVFCVSHGGGGLRVACCVVSCVVAECRVLL